MRPKLHFNFIWANQLILDQKCAQIHAPDIQARAIGGKFSLISLERKKTILGRDLGGFLSPPYSISSKLFHCGHLDVRALWDIQAEKLANLGLGFFCHRQEGLSEDQSSDKYSRTRHPLIISKCNILLIFPKCNIFLLLIFLIALDIGQGHKAKWGTFVSDLG